jgi:hypothetical protein
MIKALVQAGAGKAHFMIAGVRVRLTRLRQRKIRGCIKWITA